MVFQIPYPLFEAIFDGSCDFLASSGLYLIPNTLIYENKEWELQYLAHQ